jgi:hypothetical protein
MAGWQVRRYESATSAVLHAERKSVYEYGIIYNEYFIYRYRISTLTTSILKKASGWIPNTEASDTLLSTTHTNVRAVKLATNWLIGKYSDNHLLTSNPTATVSFSFEIYVTFCYRIKMQSRTQISQPTDTHTYTNPRRVLNLVSYIKPIQFRSHSIRRAP